VLRRIILFLPALVALIIYLPSLRSDFVYDARAQILTDNYIHEPTHLKDVLTLRVLSADVLDNDRPVHLAVYLVESMIWGRNPFGYHLTSILLHCANVLLLALLIGRWMESRALRENAPPLRQAQDRQAGPLNLADERNSSLAIPLCAACAALLFALHPINVEPIAEPSYREDLLATFFTLAGLLLSSFSVQRLAFSVFFIPLLFLLGIASKENAIVGPPVLLLYYLLCRRKESPLRWLTTIAISFAVVVGFLLLYAHIRPQHSHIFVYAPQPIAKTKLEVIAMQVRIFTLYFRNLAWPLHLSADYPITAIDPIPQTIAWIVVTLFIIAQLALLLQSRLHLLAAAIFWLGIATVANLVPIYRPIADRFLYLPLTGIAIHIALITAPLARKIPAIPILATLLLTIPLAISNFHRQRIFHDSIALWSDTLQKNGDSFTAYDNLAFAYYDIGDYPAAIRNWQQALKQAKSPAVAAEAFAGLAIGLDANGHPSDADIAYQRAISLEPRYANPQAMVDAITWERPHAAALQKIAARQHTPGMLSF
jgi:protein O-mannosyl-transferase